MYRREAPLEKRYDKALENAEHAEKTETAEMRNDLPISFPVSAFSGLAAFSLSF